MHGETMKYLFRNLLSITILLLGNILGKFKATVSMQTDLYRFWCSGDEQSCGESQT